VPLIDRRSPLTPANARNSDVAARLTEDIAPIQQQKMISAFRVQGIEAILYNRLGQGVVCSCKSQEHQVTDRTGGAQKTGPGATNSAQTGEAKFGVGSYSPLTPDQEFDDLDNFHDAETSPTNALSKWMGDLTTAGSTDGPGVNLVTDQVITTEKGQFSPDLEDIFSQFDLGSIGFSDVSCACCFGTGFIGGYSQFRGWRHVVAATQLVTQSTLDLTTAPLAMRPGVHTFTTVLPFGALVLDVFRPMNGDKVVQARILIDGVDTANKRVLNWFDGKPHVVTVETDSLMTHFEMQAATNTDPVYFELPKRNRTQDIALLEKQEPFQIILSPECPRVDTLDLIAESQMGKLLIVQNVNPWQTRNRNFLGQEIQVRVAQPAELWQVMPRRRHVAGQKTVNVARQAQAKNQGGVSAGPGDGNSFNF